MAEIKENRTASQKERTNGSPGSESAQQGKGVPDLSPRATAHPSQMAAPFVFMRRFAEDMDRLFEDFGLTHGLATPRFISRGREFMRREAGLIPADWSPQVDILERDDRLTVRADLPGLSKDDIKVEIDGDRLTIEGERKTEKNEDHEGRSYSECSYGRFFRSIPLPEGADATKATADFCGGVLEVSIPIPQRIQAQARRLEVREKR